MSVLSELRMLLALPVVAIVYGLEDYMDIRMTNINDGMMDTMQGPGVSRLDNTNINPHRASL